MCVILNTLSLETPLIIAIYVSIFFSSFSVHLKIEEHSRMLRTGDLGIPANPTDRYTLFLHK